MARDQLSLPQQEFGYKQTTGVHQAMMGAKGIRRKISAGAREALRQKMSSMYAEEGTRVGGTLRLFKMDNAGMWYDRLFYNREKQNIKRMKKAANPKELAKREKEIQKLEDEEDKQRIKAGQNPQKIKLRREKIRAERARQVQNELDEFYGDAPVPTKGGKRRSGSGSGSGSETGSIVRSGTGSIKQLKGDLSVVKAGMNQIGSMVARIGNAIGGVHQDVKDIKSLIMPKKIVTRGQRYTGEWGENKDESMGKIQFAHYNPLAPAGAQFVESKQERPKGWKKGLYRHGPPTSKPLSKGFLQSAIKQAAIQTAILTLKMEKRDREREKQQEEFKWKDEEERKEDPLEELKTDIDQRFDELEKKIGDGKKKGGLFDWLSNMLGGLWSKITDFFKNPLAILGGLAGLLPFASLIGKAGLVGLAGYLGYQLGTWLNDKFQLDVKINDAIQAAMAWFGKGNDAAVRAADKAAVDAKNQSAAEINKKLAGTGYSKSEMTISEDGTTYSGGGYVDAKGNKIHEQDLPADVRAKLGLEPMRTVAGSGPRNKRRTSRTSGQTSWVDSTPTPIAAVGDTGNLTKPSIKGGLLMPDQSIKETILAASKRVGVDPGIMLAMAKQESSFNPSAKASTSSAKGLYQFLNSTWGDMVKKYGKSYPELNRGQLDPMASALAGALFIKENGAILTKAGIPIDGTSIYAAHFLGAGGAKKLFSANPNTDATKLMPAPAEANRHIFYNKDGSPRTVAQVQQALFEKVGKYAAMYSESVGGSSTMLASTATPSPVQASAIPSTSGTAIDMGNRQLSASSSGVAGVTVIQAPTTVNQTNNTVGKRPAARADVVSRDEALVRVANRDSKHPVYG